jgi:hypothetical protein
MVLDITGDTVSHICAGIGISASVAVDDAADSKIVVIDAATIDATTINAVSSAGPTIIAIGAAIVTAAVAIEGGICYIAICDKF